MVGFWVVIVLCVIGVVVYALLAGKAGMQKEYRDSQQGFADLLRYAEPLDDGVLMGKGGELIAGFYFRGGDADSASNSELEGRSARLNAVLARLGSGWMVHVDAVRGPAIGYSTQGAFLSAVTRGIDDERRTQYETEDGGHFESRFAMVFTFVPPPKMESRATEMLFEQSADLRDSAGSLHDKIIKKFMASVRDLESQLGSVFEGVSRMKCREVQLSPDCEPVVFDELMGFLHFCVTGIRQEIVRPNAGTSADYVIGSQDFWGGTQPRVGRNHVRVVSIDGFPGKSVPVMLGALNTLPTSYRWNSRFIFLDPEEGRGLLGAVRKKWKQKIRGMKDQFMGTQSGAVDEDAMEMTKDAQTAMSIAASGVVRFGLYTSTVVLMDEDPHKAQAATEECVKLIRNMGFAARVETVNAVEAYLGSLPGHGYENVRRPPIHSLNLVHFLPTTSTWAGPTKNPNPFYRDDNAVLLYAATTGNAPFRFNLHVDDRGHTLIVGPTGAGKSTILELIEAQHGRYKGARVYKFEKGYSSFVLCNGSGGQYYDIGGEGQNINFCPLARVDKPSERFWAEGWIETLVALQGVSVAPYHRSAIRQALLLLAQSEPGRRSMTEFAAAVQDAKLQEALAPYTLGEQNPMLDAESDMLMEGHFQVFEMEHLMDMGDRYAVPVLLYLFRCIERQLDGSPVIIVIDEAWLMLNHPIFRDKIKEWLKVMRKANCAVVFATQSISDVGKCEIRDVIYESCPTKILLPNAEARSNQVAISVYQEIGLNDRQIDMIAMATPKRDYYYMSPLGRRMFRLGLGPMCLSFVGASGKEDVSTARALMLKFGDAWVVEWLKYCASTKPWGRDLYPWIERMKDQLCPKIT